MASPEGTERPLSAAEAAARLGVKAETLYAYVSRGILTSNRSPDGRTSIFDPADIDRLVRRPRGRRTAELVFESAISTIRNSKLYFRGIPATEIADGREFEEVAEWIWYGRFPRSRQPSWTADPAGLLVARKAQEFLPADVLPINRLPIALTALASVDHLPDEQYRGLISATAEMMIAGIVEVLPLVGPTPKSSASIAARLWSRLTSYKVTPEFLDVLNSALSLSTDNELSSSTVAVRVAAANGADPYSVVSVGLGTVNTIRRRPSLNVEDFLRGIEPSGDVNAAVRDALHRGAKISGLGHPMYPGGDPRTAFILERLEKAASSVPGGKARMAVVNAVLAEIDEQELEQPIVQFAVAALAYVANMVRGAGEVIFLIARAAGWLAHAREEYERATPIRPRAHYVGPPLKI